MSNKNTDFLIYKLYPTLFQSIDTALPEFNFKRKGSNWISSNKLKLTGEEGDSIGKVYVWQTAPGFIKDFTRGNSSIVDYVISRDNIDFIQAVKKLADVVGLEIPKGDFNQESYQSYKDQATILEDCNSYFIYCLETSTGADKVKAYLSSRGYNLEDVKAMEIGYIPNQESLNKYLLKKGYSQSLIDEVVKLKTDTRIGSTHSLTIPYRSGGSIKGFKFRTIGEDTPKYLNSSGLDKNGGFFNLLGIKGDKDIVIVEGELDSLLATAKGVENIVATGGSSINKDQVKDAIKRGAKSFTICLDTEPNKEETTAKNINSAIEVILGEGVNKVYIVTLPDLGGGKTDPDRLIIESGVDSFKTAIAQALPYFIYKLNEILNKYIKIEEDNGLLTFKDKDNLLDEVVTVGSTLSPLDREQYIKSFINLKAIEDIGITEESLAITVDKLSTTKDKEAQATEFKKLLTEATKLQDKGEIDKALELLNSRVKEVKLKDKATEFSSLLIPIKEDQLRERLSNKPESLNSGYTIGGDELLLPSGAITVLSAPTSHGKTTFLINLALNVAQTYPDKEAYFFSYEEDSDSILINALNTYLDTTLSGNNRTTLKNYFTGGNSRTIEGKDKFFKELIDTKRLNIHYSNYSSDTLIEAIRYLHKHAKPGAIFIDYIQLLKLPKGKNNTYSRQEEIKQICLDLKDIAVETGLPIILGAQFNRTVTNQLHLHATKIGEAGDIERIANLIIGFWNNNLPTIASEGELNEIKVKGYSTPNTIYATVLKNRGGVVGGEDELSFNGNIGKISNISNTSKKQKI